MIRKMLLLMVGALLLVSCAAHKPIEGAVPGRIKVVSVDAGPYQNAQINHFFTLGLNDYAGFPIVDGSVNAPYKVEVKILSSNSQVAGYRHGFFAPWKTNVKYQARIEYSASLVNPHGDVLWTNTTYAESDSEENAIYTMAKDVSLALYNNQMLVPSFYADSH